MKLRIIFLISTAVLILAFFISACKKTAADLPYNPTYINLAFPSGWPVPPVDIFANNRLTEEGFQLGKKLFYDGRLSKDGNYPCSSCHEQYAAFVTYDHDFSHGINNSFTYRNAPGLFNLAWMTKQHWDGGVDNLEAVPNVHITAANEMGETISSVINKLKVDTAYPRLFQAAFGTFEINSGLMAKALAQFTGSIVSFNSKYDKVKRGEASFTGPEQNGYNFFKTNCETCHKEPLFTDNSFRNNGLAVNPFLNDFGRMRVTNDRNDSLKFKVPSLRNVLLTFPYMHDGRIYSLGQTIDHYSSGIITTQPTLDSLLRNRIVITTNQKNDLIYFLNTLTDTTMTKSPRFAQ